MDVCDELRNVFLTHGAVCVDSVVLAPKPAPVSSFGVLEVRRMHAPSVSHVNGLDISSVAAELSRQPMRELETHLASGCTRDGLDAGHVHSYARYHLGRRDNFVVSVQIRIYAVAEQLARVEKDVLALVFICLITLLGFLDASLHRALF